MNSDVITGIAERHILEAMAEGKFDNLPGTGLPIIYDEDPTIPLPIRMANKVLKNAGVVPEWIQFRTDIIEERRAVVLAQIRFARENEHRTLRLRALDLHHNHPLVAAYAEWHAKTRTAYLAMLKSVNTSILKFCMNAPSTVSSAEPFAPYKIETTMMQFDAEFPSFANVEVRPGPQKDESRLRMVARAMYGSRKKIDR